MFKKIMGSLLAVAMLASMGATVYASPNEEITEQESTITAFYNSINGSEWDKWASYYAPPIQDAYIDFATDADNQEENRGVLAVSSVEILSIQKTDDNLAPRYRELEEYYGSGNFDCFTVAMNLTVKEETKYFSNGFREDIVTMVKDGNEWYIGVCSKGDSSKSRIGTGALDVDISSPPSTITTADYKGKDGNKLLVGKAYDVDFDTFVKTVVYGEIGTQSYLEDAVIAVTVSDRMYSWWCVIAEYRATYGCDVISKFDVNYIATNEGKGTDAFKSMVDKGLSKYVLTSQDKIFSVGANNFSKFDYAGSGNVVQSGAQRLAKEKKTWKQILHHYLDNSSYNWANAGIVKVG